MSDERTRRRPGRPKKVIPPEWDGTKPSLPDHQWKALGKEFQGIHDWVSLGEQDPWPSKTLPFIVARAAGKSTMAVSKWRKDILYRRGLQWLINQYVIEQLEKGLHKRDIIKNEGSTQIPLSKEKRAALLYYDVKRDWTGSVTSIVDGKTYNTVEEYVDHLLEERD